mmetsp:Transcript_34474/g.67457  ORF Transcript_34474/g.67457 Transcript_34474/m.67457 type:complete len:225 (+) Transcript_34474:634-1308(+)
MVLQSVDSRFGHKAFGVNHPAPFAGILQLHSSLNKSCNNQVCNARSRLPSAHKEVGLILQVNPLLARSGYEPRECYRGCPLNVVVERADLVAILLEEAEGVGVAEVLKLNQNPRVPCVELREHLLHKLIIFLPHHSLVRQPSVVLVVEELLIVGSNVSDDGKASFGVNARACRVEIQFSHRDAHAVCAEIAQAQNTLSVGDDYDRNLFFRPVPEDLGDAASLLQ